MGGEHDCDGAMAQAAVDVDPLLQQSFSVAAAARHPPGQRGWAATTLLAWLWPIVRKGYSTPLQASDIPNLPSHLEAAAARSSGASWWAGQVATGARPTLLKMVMACHRTEFALGMLASVVYGLLNVVLRPLLLKVTIETVARISAANAEAGNGGANQSGEETLQSAMLIVAIGLSLMVEGIVAAASKHFLSDQLGTAMFGKVAALVQRKAVRLQSASADVQPSTLIGSDMVRAFEATKMLSLLPMCISGILGGFVLLVVTIGWAGVLGISIMVGITLLNIELGKRIKIVEHKEMLATDHRLAIIRQVIHDIKPIKLCSW